MRKQALHPRTAIINQKQKNLSKRARLEALRWLAQTFPLAFDNTKRIAPLSIGIMNQLLEHADDALKAGISKSKLREAVVVYTRRLDYLACLKAREMRVDLHGEPTVIVSEEDAERAALKIKKRIEKTTRSLQASVKPVSTPLRAPKKTIMPTHESFYHDEREDGLDIASPAPTAAVTIKHKSSRAFDPDAVARLKEKLGLSRQKADDNQ